MEGILANLNTGVLKEPRGFIKILQFVFSICAFATTTSFITSFSYLVTCGADNTTFAVSENIVYPFRIDSIRPKYKICEDNTEQFYLSGDFSSDAEFFVAVGVLAFLYVIGALALYTYFNSMYENNELVPLVDCGVHVVFAILWLAASSAWVNSLTNLRMATNMKTIFDENPDMCTVYSCESTKEPSYSKLYISVILGFLNVFLWASNLWFLYKETRYCKDKMNAKDTAANPPGNA